jgi:CubicO group peptidase (beta-lactamase class C family)
MLRPGLDWTDERFRLREAMRETVETIAREAIAAAITPGGVLSVSDGGAPVLMLPFGRTQSVPVGAGEEVTAETIYDIASLTKPLAISGVLMKLIESGAVALETPARTLVPELVTEGSEAITIAHLVGHSAGFPDHVKFYERLWAGDLAGAASARDALIRMAGATPLIDPPGRVTRYSDVGYILLGAALERAAGQRLDAAVARLVTEPLAMTSTFFVDLIDLEAPDHPPIHPRAAIAPTEVCERRGLLRGEVHDENAHAAGGICGHAGLFSTAADVARFAAAVCDAATGIAGHFDPAIVRMLTTTASTPGSTWRLGWDTPSRTPGVSHAGDSWPRDGFGHLAFTGCSMWLDPPRRRHVVLLTNRVHPTRNGTGIRELRRAVMDAVVAALSSS